MYVSNRIEMELNIQVNGKIKKLYMVMELCNPILPNILGSLGMDLSIFMADKQRNNKYIKVNLSMGGEKVRV